MAFLGTDSAKLPSRSVIAPVVVPLTSTLTPTSGSPEASVTLPETAFWANACTPMIRSADKTIMNLLVINFGFNNKVYILYVLSVRC